MIAEVPEAIAAMLARGERERLYAPPSPSVVLDRAAVQTRLPHRDPLLLLDEVHGIDRERALIAASYELDRAREVFAGHFPGYPAYPGVLQVEAIGQAGILLHQVLRGEEAGPLEAIALTHILAARFLSPVKPGARLEIVAHAFEDGLFFGVAGQCLQAGRVCAVAAVAGLV
jgi:3-hydroxyacyl-[acyl-carrier-protein] dehydratase